MALNGIRRCQSVVNLGLKRAIMMSAWNSVKAEGDLLRNPYYDKYSNKIKALKENNKDEFLSRLQANEIKKSEEESDVEDMKPVLPVAAAYPEPKKEGKFRRRQLSELMNLELLKGKTEEEIHNIWFEYYCSKDNVIYGTMTKENFEGFIHHCRRYPVFVVPLPRGDGFEFFMVQFQDDEFHLTPMALYHKYKENSPETICVTYFSELEQNIVLMLGEYDGNVLKPFEAQCLVNSLILFYNTEARRDLVRVFNESPESFDYNDLLREIDNLSLMRQ